MGYGDKIVGLLETHKSMEWLVRQLKCPLYASHFSLFSLIVGEIFLVIWYTKSSKMQDVFSKQ